jgi:hypothetical protein
VSERAPQIAAILICFVCAAIAAGCIVLRFPPVAAVVPAGLAALAFPAVGFALGGAVAAEAHLPRGTVGPLWMRIQRPPALALALGLSFCTTVIAQVLDVSLGPVDPTFPADAPFGINALWFFMFTIGFAGIGMMSAPGVFLPLLGPIAGLLKKATLPVGVIVLGGALAAGGLAFAWSLTAPELVDEVARAKAWAEANETIVTLAMIAVMVVPALMPAVRRKDD